MKPRLNMEKITKGLGAVHRGKIPALAGYFSAPQLAALLLERTAEKLSGDEAEEIVNAALLRR